MLKIDLVIFYSFFSSSNFTRTLMGSLPFLTDFCCHKFYFTFEWGIKTTLWDWRAHRDITRTVKCVNQSRKFRHFTLLQHKMPRKSILMRLVQSRGRKMGKLDVKQPKSQYDDWNIMIYFPFVDNHYSLPSHNTTIRLLSLKWTRTTIENIKSMPFIARVSHHFSCIAQAVSLMSENCL